MSLPLKELGEYAKAAREERGVSQEQLAKDIGQGVNRTAVALLEQGRRVPPATALSAICRHLGIPQRFWADLRGESQSQRAFFEDALGELVGRRVSLREHDSETVKVAHHAAVGLFNTSMTVEQLYGGFCSVLVNYDVTAPSRTFFQKFLGTEAFANVESFERKIQAYQVQAIRLYSSFAAAYEHLSTTEDLAVALAPLEKRSDATFRGRTAWAAIEEIPEERLPDLGYISAARVHKEKNERELLCRFLSDLATEIDASGPGALNMHSAKKLRKIGSLLRKFKSTIPHDFISPLFFPDPDRLRREASLLAPKGDEDIARMETTQATGLRNLARYLAADYMDIYVATSMRSDADFASVNSFVRRLFRHNSVHPLKLRYFNPTQSWIEDRVAKGLVEALMLKRSAVTIYLAQKSDSFGKDSEASVALGQGKPVVVYVPSLTIPAADVNSEALGKLSRSELQKIVEQEADDSDGDFDETTDEQALFSQVLEIRLRETSDAQLAQAVKLHWADFDLYGEDVRIGEASERARYRAWLDAVVSEDDALPSLDSDVRSHLIGILVATAVNAEKRATVFREVHPLALQVILSTGVLNGILVVRSLDACADVLSRLVHNDLDLELRSDDQNYRLVERSTSSTIRVIARHPLIGNAFAAFYKNAVHDIWRDSGENA